MRNSYPRAACFTSIPGIGFISLEMRLCAGFNSYSLSYCMYATHILPYCDKRKQLLEIIFLANDQHVSVMYIDINAISLCLDLNIFQYNECFCSKLGLEVEHAKTNLKRSVSQIWVICHLLPFVRVRQNNGHS